MNKIIEWVKEQKWEYQTREKADELDLKICPVCGAVSKKTGQVKSDNYWSFSINMRKGSYKCLRGSCGAKGHVNMLSSKKLHTGDYIPIETDFKEDEFKKEVAEKIGKPALTFEEIENKEYKEKAKINLLEKRGISQKTLTKLKCLFSKKDGHLMIPAYEFGICVNYKLRFIEPKEWKGRTFKSINSKYGKSVFYGMQNAIEYDKPLVIVEGDYEYLSLVEAGYDNVVSIPSGASSVNFVENCWEFLDSFKEIILWYDNDEAGESGKKKMTVKLEKWKLKEIVSQEKDANDVLITHGPDKIHEYIKNATVIDVEGIINITKVQRKRLRDIDAVSTGIYGIDVHTKGKRDGELTVISGKNNHGKSTYIGQEILNLIQNDRHVFLYSGELSKEMVKEWLFTQACTQMDLLEYKHPITKLSEYEVKEGPWKKIDKWMNNKMFLYNKSDVAKEDELLAIINKAYYQMGCTHFYLDNLMMMKLENTGDDIYKKQAGFMNSLKSFTLKGPHINVIVHPFKTDKETLTKDDIGGAGEITNIADNVIIVHRRDTNDDKFDFPAMIKIDKGRIGGTGEIQLDFNPDTKRFFTPNNDREKNFKYSWNNINDDGLLEVEEDTEMFPDWEGDR